MHDLIPMTITYLQWHKDYDNDGQRTYMVRRPSWKKVMRVFDRLNSQEYASFFLYFHEDIKRYPRISVIGGTEGYSLTLSCGDADGRWTRTEISYLNQTVAHSPIAHHVRGVGKGYTNWEIEEQFLTDDRTTIIYLLEHIVRTGRWPADIPSLVEHK
jgi:hypothetical protein